MVINRESHRKEMAALNEEALWKEGKSWETQPQIREVLKDKAHEKSIPY